MRTRFLIVLLLLALSPAKAEEAQHHGTHCRRQRESGRRCGNRLLLERKWSGHRSGWQANRPDNRGGPKAVLEPFWTDGAFLQGEKWG